MDAHLAPLAGLALVLDRGTDATFALLSLVRQAQGQGLKVVFAAAADTPAHYEAALRKGAGRHAGGAVAAAAAAAAAPPPITWVPLIAATPSLWGEAACGAGGGGGGRLAHAGALVVAAVEGAGPPEGVCLVLDSLTALRDAAPDPPSWRSFLASPAVLASPAAVVIARADADAAGSGEPPRWLPALTAAASVSLTAAPLPSGAAAGVDGMLTLERRAAGGGAAGQGGRSPLAGAVFSFAAMPAGGVRVEERR